VQQTTNFNVVHSAAFGGGVEMTVEPSHRVGQSADMGLQIRPCTFFDQTVLAPFRRSAASAA
jgi:hypothetical protein